MKTKKSILISIFALALMVFGVSAVKAADADPLGVQNYRTFCLDGDKKNPINKTNATTLCYVIAAGWNNTNGDSAGFISQAYAGDGIKIIGTQTYVVETGSVWVEAGSAAGNNSKVTANDTKAPEALQQGKVFCPAAYFAKNNKALKGIESSGCGIFYSQGDDKFSAANMANSKGDIITKDLTESSATTQYGVIGAYKVQITATKGTACGQICVQTSEIKTGLDWTCVAAESSSEEPKKTDGTACGTDTTTTPATPPCTEVHYDLTPKAEPENEKTGAFASYTILAAGALIAISAITIAKKHNRMSKI